MADRYSMNFNPGMQHQQQMGHPQDSHQPVPGFPDQGPMWQQMQQMQNQFRPQSTGMEQPHVPPQVAELMRRQGQQQQQSQSQQQPQQQFGLGMGGGQPGGSQSFHDPSNQPPSQSHPGFQNLGNPSLQTLNNRSAMFQQANNPATHRQLDLMAMALNQQQNGPINFAARMQQQQAALNGQPGMGQQPNSADNNFMSPSMPNAEAMRRPSPSHPVVPPGAAGGAQPPQVTRASFNTLQERATNLKNIIANQESQLVQLNAQRARIGDAAFMDKVRSVAADLKNRKEHYTRLVHFLHQMQQQLQMNGGQQNMPGMQPNAGPQASQPAWMPPGPSQPQPQPPSFNQNANVGQPRPNPGMLPPFSANSMPTSAPFQSQEGRPFPPIPPLEKGRFENVYKNFCTQRNVVHSSRLMSLETRPIDLFDLHTHVMLEGGASNVAQKDLWAVIGGRMGFVQFPASDTEPAKSGPGAAQHLAHVYKEYLMQFDSVYIQTVMDQRRKNDALTAAQRGLGMNGPAPMRAGISDPVQMQQVLNYLPIPPLELRRRGVPEQIIQFIENNRTTLMKTVMDQGNFRAGIRPGDQNGMHGGMAQPPFPQGGMNNGMMQPGRPFMHQNGMPNAPMEGGQQPHSVLTRPSREHLTAAMQHIAKLKSDYSPERMLQNVPPIDVPAEQRMEYNTVLEQLHRACMELDHKLPMLFAVLKKEDVVRRLVIIVQTAIQQRAMISSGTTRFLVTLDTLRTMLQQVQDMNERFAAVLQGLMVNKPPNMTTPIRPPVPNPPGPINPQSIPQPPNSTNGLPPQPQRPLNLQNPPPSRALKRPPNAAPSPTPPPIASASTPVNNAPTPRDNMASPPAPKSPKGKAPVKPKTTQRRQSVGKKNATAAATPPPPPSETAASPAGSNKRPREDEPSPPQQGPSPGPAGPSVANEPSPPKRQKMQWDGPPSEALKARAEMVENVKTEEEGAAFLEQMTELFKMAAGNDGQPDSVSSDFSETLDTLFKGFGAVPDDGVGGITSLGMGDATVNAQDGPPPVVDEFVEFFDFSSFGAGDEDDSGSKAETPDLISSSSTNPSPESGSEVDTVHQTLASDVKTEDFSEQLRLGVWKEVDGGESAYFHAGPWKWDSPMQSLEQPWAVFNS